MRIIDTSTLISYDVFTLVLLCLTKSKKDIREVLPLQSSHCILCMTLFHAPKVPGMSDRLFACTLISNPKAQVQRHGSVPRRVQCLSCRPGISGAGETNSGLSG
jgi:hypothetical protein